METRPIETRFANRDAASCGAGCLEIVKEGGAPRREKSRTFLQKTLDIRPGVWQTTQTDWNWTERRETCERRE